MHVTIDEIKGIYMNLDALDEPVGVHRAQAMCYAYIYALRMILRSLRCADLTATCTID